MSKSWRPKGWQCPYWTPPSDEDSIGRKFRWEREGLSRGEAYEAGADAMLKALEPLIRKIAPSSKLIDILYKTEGNYNGCCGTNKMPLLWEGI